MMAGDVQVRISGENVTIIGTNESDRITVYTDGGEVVVAQAFGSSTTVNGVAEFETGVFGLNKLNIRMRGGDDFVQFSDVPVNGRSRINMGSSFTGDEVYFGLNFSNFDRMNIRTGSGTDSIVFDSSNSNGSMMVNTGGGNDDVTITNGSKFFSTLVVKTGGGEDQIESRDWRVGSAERIHMVGGGGQDELRMPLDSFALQFITHAGIENVAPYTYPP